MDKFIKKKQFMRSLVCQPFFIWNSLKNEVEIEKDEEEMVELFWDFNEEDEVDESTAGQVLARTFRLIDENLMELLKRDHQVVYLKGTVEERIAETLKFINSDKVIVNPAFEYSNAVSTPFAFDAKEKEIINIKYSMKTKLKDILSYQYDYEIISRNTEVKNCFIYLPWDKDYKKKEILLRPIDVSGFTKTGVKQEDMNSGTEETETGELQGVNKTPRLIEVLESREILTKIKKPSKKNPTMPVVETLKLPDFEKQLKIIKNAASINEVSEELFEDSTIWGTNPEWNELLAKINSPIQGYNGVVFKKSHPRKGEWEDEENESQKEMFEWFFEDQKPPITFDGEIWSSVWAKLDEIEKSNQIYINKEKLSPYKYLKAASNIVWYDFEGYSLPYAPIDHVKPYNQIVFQVSVIQTLDNNEIFKENLVLDPLKLSSDDFIKISRAIYKEGAEYYVVYNKTYELSRLKEMLAILNLEGHADAEEFHKHFEEISNKTIDLCDLFVINSKDKMPGVMLPDQKARYSIKNVEKHITANKIKLPRPITPYKELVIQNGTAAMKAAIDRALEITGDLEWKTIVEGLKKYCENDVRAMIMVYDYVDYLLEKNAN